MYAWRSMTLVVEEQIPQPQKRVIRRPTIDKEQCGALLNSAYGFVELIAAGAGTLSVSVDGANRIGHHAAEIDRNFDTRDTHAANDATVRHNRLRAVFMTASSAVPILMTEQAGLDLLHGVEHSPRNISVGLALGSVALGLNRLKEKAGRPEMWRRRAQQALLIPTLGALGVGAQKMGHFQAEQVLAMGAGIASTRYFWRGAAEDLKISRLGGTVQPTRKHPADGEVHNGGSNSQAPLGAPEGPATQIVLDGRQVGDAQDTSHRDPKGV